ncbi:unnamed protein product [Chrysoparadoxa australica]
MAECLKMPRARIGQVGAANSPEQWYKELPPVSKVLLTSIVGCTLLVLTGVVSPYSLALFWDSVWNKFEIWRFYTSVVFLGAPSFPFLMNLFIFGQYSIRYEKDPFNTGGGGGSADYCWMLIFGAVSHKETTLTVLSVLSITFLNQPFLAKPLMFMVIYVWSRKTPNAVASFWGIQVQSVYVPWVMVAFQLLIGNSIYHPLMGIGVGHLYYFLVDVLPDRYGKEILFTPNFLVDQLGYGETSGVTRVAPTGFGQTAAPPGFPRTGGSGGSGGGGGGVGGHAWGGGGRVLGTR